MDKLKQICGGWYQRGDLIVSAHPLGGIIDKNVAGLGWFIVYNDDRPMDTNWYETQEAAINAFCG